MDITRWQRGYFFSFDINNLKESIEIVYNYFICFEKSIPSYSGISKFFKWCMDGAVKKDNHFHLQMCLTENLKVVYFEKIIPNGLTETGEHILFFR